MSAKTTADRFKPRPSETFANQFAGAVAASKRLGEDILAAAAYFERNGPVHGLAPRMLACMLSASAVTGELLKAAITLAANGGD